MSLENTEQWKYQVIYGQQEAGEGFNTYGHSNHGKPYMAIVQEARSLIDVGCGHNQFVQALRERNVHDYPEFALMSNFIGIDFACPGADRICDIVNGTGYVTKFEWVTAFDVLEHLTEEQVMPALFEMRRISEKFMFVISTVPSKNMVVKQTLHPTVKPTDWWVAMLDRCKVRFRLIENKPNRCRIVGDWK